jgi:hypothetical protein
MADSLIAEFPSQFAASAAVDMLLSRGVARDQLALRFDETVGELVAQDERHQTRGTRIAHRIFRQHALPDLPNPQRSGHTGLVVRLDDATAAPDLTNALREVGATSVQRLDTGPTVKDSCSETRVPPTYPRH